MNIMPLLFAIVLVAFAIFGLVSLILACCFLKTLSQRVSDFWTKLVSKLIKFPSILASIFGTYAATHKEEWLPTAIAGALSAFLWEIVESLVDHQTKKTNALAADALSRAEQQSRLRTNLLVVFRKAVDDKTKRIQKQANAAKQQVRVEHIRNALAPNPYIEELLNGLAVFFREQHSAPGGQTRNIRVGVYVNQDGVMKPIQSLSLNDSCSEPFSSYNTHQPAFQVNASGNRALIVSCILEKRMLIVDDCVESAKAGAFFFFREEQKGYLRSMATYFLGKVAQENGKMVEGVLAVDTDAPGFFKEADRDSLEFSFREFAARLKLELALNALLASKRGRS